MPSTAAPKVAVARAISAGPSGRRLMTALNVGPMPASSKAVISCAWLVPTSSPVPTQVSKNGRIARKKRNRTPPAVPAAGVGGRAVVGGHRVAEPLDLLQRAAVPHPRPAARDAAHQPVDDKVAVARRDGIGPGGPEVGLGH